MVPPHQRHHRPRLSTMRATRHARDPRAVAAALALVLTAALVALSTHLGTKPDVRLQALGPRIDALVLRNGFLADDDVPPARRTPCRVTGSLRADPLRSWKNAYHGFLPGDRLRRLEVVVYRLPDPARRIREAAERLERCGAARSGPFVLRYRDFSASGDVRTWRFDAESPQLRSGGIARMFPAGEYVVYLADQWTDTEPGTFLVDQLTTEIASLVTQYG